jgi:hypothetical protein
MSDTGGVHGGGCCQSSQSQFLSELRGFLEVLSEFLEETADRKGGHGRHKCDSRRRDDRDCGPGGQHPPRHDCGDDRDDHCDDTESYTGTARIWGDPHVEYDITIAGGTTSEGKFDTKGGAGEEINLLDTDRLDITGEFVSWKGNKDVTVVGSETITAGRDTIEIDAKTNEVTLNGREICDGEYSQNGNKITKRGDTVTIVTADGQTVIVKDQGEHLDTDLKLKDLKTEEMGGMIGDAARGKPNADATRYIVEESDCGGGPSGGNDCCPRQDASWASGLLRFLAADPCMPRHVSNMMLTLANLFDSGHGSHHHARAA